MSFSTFLLCNRLMRHLKIPKFVLLMVKKYYGPVRICQKCQLELTEFISIEYGYYCIKHGEKIKRRGVDEKNRRLLQDFNYYYCHYNWMRVNIKSGKHLLLNVDRLKICNSTVNSYDVRCNDLQNCIFRGVIFRSNFSNKHFKNCIFQDCRFVSCELRNTTFEFCQFLSSINCFEFETCDISNLKFINCCVTYYSNKAVAYSKKEVTIALNSRRCHDFEVETTFYTVNVIERVPNNNRFTKYHRLKKYAKKIPIIQSDKKYIFHPLMEIRDVITNRDIYFGRNIITTGKFMEIGILFDCTLFVQN